MQITLAQSRIQILGKAWVTYWWRISKTVSREPGGERAKEPINHFSLQNPRCLFLFLLENMRQCACALHMEGKGMLIFRISKGLITCFGPFDGISSSILRRGEEGDRKHRQHQILRKGNMPRRVLRPEVLRSIRRQSSVLLLGQSWVDF